MSHILEGFSLKTGSDRSMMDDVFESKEKKRRKKGMMCLSHSPFVLKLSLSKFSANLHRKVK